MNIFIFDLDPQINTQYYPNSYTIKMALESTQLLSTAVYLHWSPKTSVDNFKECSGLYRPSHQRHPCTLWTAATRSNFLYLTDLTKHICDEYTYRYGKIHASLAVANKAKEYAHFIPEGPLTPFALAMPEAYKSNDAVQSYRDYFNAEKKHLMKWKNRSVPEWIKKEI